MWGRASFGNSNDFDLCRAHEKKKQFESLLPTIQVIYFTSINGPIHSFVIEQYEYEVFPYCPAMCTERWTRTGTENEKPKTMIQKSKFYWTGVRSLALVSASLAAAKNNVIRSVWGHCGGTIIQLMLHQFKRNTENDEQFSTHYSLIST